MRRCITWNLFLNKPLYIRDFCCLAYKVESFLRNLLCITLFIFTPLACLSHIKYVLKGSPSIFITANVLLSQVAMAVGNPPFCALFRGWLSLLRAECISP